MTFLIWSFFIHWNIILCIWMSCDILHNPHPTQEHTQDRAYENKI